MKRIKSYGEILEFVKESKKIYELAMNPEKIENIKRLKESGDLSGLLKELKGDFIKKYNIVEEEFIENF